MIYSVLLTAISILLINHAGAQTQTVGLFWNDSLAYNGYTLFAPMNHKHVYLIDNCGYQVHNWSCGPYNNHMAYLLEDGSLLRTGVVQSYHFQAGGRCGIVHRYSWEGDLMWEFEYHSDSYHQHHDIEPLPNGNFLMIAWYKYTPQEAIAKGKDPQELQDELWMEHILEVEPASGNIVWEWSSWDHLIQDFDPTKENYGTVAYHPERIDINYTDDSNPGTRVDWLHVNSVEYNAELDQILISPRNYSEIWIIDHSTTTEEAAGSTGGMYGKGGDLLYRWGNPEAYDRGDENDQLLRFMHDPAWIPEDYTDGGKISVFNNSYEFQQSSIMVFDPPQDSPGFYTDPGSNAYGPLTYDWIYDGDELYSSTISGAQRLANGNTLICEGQGGIFTEVTYDEKEIVWKYRCPVNIFGRISQGSTPHDISQFTVFRFGSVYPGLEGRELIPGDPVELNPWVYDCTIYGDTLTNIATSHQVEDIHVVNPFTNELEVYAEGLSNTVIEVFNMQGVLMTQQKVTSGSVVIPTHSWPKGMYVLKVKRSGWHFSSLKVIKIK
jgi:hypothetical protein